MRLHTHTHTHTNKIINDIIINKRKISIAREIKVKKFNNIFHPTNKQQHQQQQSKHQEARTTSH